MKPSLFRRLLLTIATFVIFMTFLIFNRKYSYTELAYVYLPSIINRVNFPTLHPIIRLNNFIVVPGAQKAKFNYSAFKFGLKGGFHERDSLILTSFDAELALKKGLDIEKLHGCTKEQGLYGNYRLINMLRVDTKTYGKNVLMYMTEHNNRFFTTELAQSYMNGTGCDLRRAINEGEIPDLVIIEHSIAYKNYQRWNGVSWLLQINSEPPTFVGQTKPFLADVQWQSDYTNKSIAPAVWGFYARFNKPECGTPQSEKKAILRMEGLAIRSHIPSDFMGRESVAYALISNVKNDWVYSNRGEYLEEFAKYFPLHTYGENQERPCPKDSPDCLQALAKKYKFYMSFENSKCKQYISEKFFHNSMQYEVIPVVLGSEKSDFEAFAPPHSYIHVDDFASPRELAQYLHKIKNDEVALSSYFAWKQFGQVVGPSAFFFPACVAIKDAIVRNYFPISLTNARTRKEECF